MVVKKDENVKGITKIGECGLHIDSTFNKCGTFNFIIHQNYPI